MKLKSLITKTILMTTLFILNTTTALAAAPNGHLDSVNGNTISGWAIDSNAMDSAVPIKVTVTKQGTTEIVKEVTTSAASYREDLAASGKGSGNYGFQVIVDWSQLESGMYQIQAEAGGKSLPNSLLYNTSSQETVSASGYNGALRSLGVFRTTAYCPCFSCSEGWGRRTSTGATATASHTIAVDPRVIPYGSKILINGTIYTAEDKGGGVKGKHIDIFFNSHGETRQYGTRSVEAFLIP